MFLFQVLFGAITLPANYVALLAMNRLGRRLSQMLFLLLLGGFILAITFVPQGEKGAQVEEWNRLPPFPGNLLTPL